LKVSPILLAVVAVHPKLSRQHRQRLLAPQNVGV